MNVKERTAKPKQKKVEGLKENKICMAKVFSSNINRTCHDMIVDIFKTKS